MVGAQRTSARRQLISTTAAMLLTACVLPKYTGSESSEGGGTAGRNVGVGSQPNSSAGDTSLPNGGTGARPSSEGGSVSTRGGVAGVTAGGSSSSLGGMDVGGAVNVGGAETLGGSGPSGGAGGNMQGNGGSTAGGGVTQRGGTSSIGGSVIAGSGGQATGGRATGGNVNGGGGTAGKATGGVSTGGVSTGGVSTGGVSTGGNATGGFGGKPGWATRYWDCCKPSCGWSLNTAGRPAVASCGSTNVELSGFDAQDACSNGPAYMCWDLAPWNVNTTLSYGFASFNGVACGTCFEIRFTGACRQGGTSCASLLGKTMFVQVVSIGGMGADQFDLLIPGGGVGMFDACSRQWSTTNLGTSFGGFIATCGTDLACLRSMCNATFTGRPQLLSGCLWSADWFGGANNPELQYRQVTCPSELTSRGMP